MNIILIWIQTGILIITGALIWWYTYEASKTRKEISRSNDINARTNEANLIIQIDNIYFSKRNDTLIENIAYNNLEYNQNQEEFCLKNPWIVKNSSNSYSVHQVDYLLGCFEYLGIFYKNKNLTVPIIYDSFYSYLKDAFDCDGIKQYIKIEREKPNCSDLYNHFELVYAECKKYSERILNGN